MILRRDTLISVVEGSSIQLVATPGAEWIRTANPVLGRNLIDEDLIPVSGGGERYWSPRGFYVRLTSSLEGEDGAEVLAAGSEVFVDPSSSVTLVGKAGAGPLPLSNRSHVDALIGSVLLGAAIGGVVELG